MGGKIAGFALRALVFPWGIWEVVALAPRWLRRARPPHARLGRSGAIVFHVVLYLGLGLPATLAVAGELLISANEWLIGEQADYRLQSDFAAGLAAATVELPGPRTARSAPPDASDAETLRRHLVALYAPVIVQKVAHHPEWDLPVRLDFDGNGDPRDNVVNEPAHRPHAAAVYGEVTAETGDSYYLTYSTYRVKDYDHPLRERLTDWTFHDSDNEGWMLRVDKSSGKVVEMEAWFHNRFLFYNLTGESSGSEPVHGTIHFEDGTHPLIYAQSQGHGVRAFQALDLDALDGNVKILRHRPGEPAVAARADRSVQTDVTYELVGFDAWYAQALGPFGSEGRGTGLFEESILLGHWTDGSEIRIGRFIAGRDYSKLGWSRPKPPWSWDDGWDRIPVFAWHFLPSRAFASHGGSRLSHHYLYNRPLEKTFGPRSGELLQRLVLPLELRSGDKWEKLETLHGGELPREAYWRVFEGSLKRYVNYVFHALG
jgi:hypothetical protein